MWHDRQTRTITTAATTMDQARPWSGTMLWKSDGGGAEPVVGAGYYRKGDGGGVRGRWGDGGGVEVSWDTRKETAKQHRRRHRHRHLLGVSIMCCVHLHLTQLQRWVLFPGIPICVLDCFNPKIIVQPHFILGYAKYIVDGFTSLWWRNLVGFYFSSSAIIHYSIWEKRRLEYISFISKRLNPLIVSYIPL